MRAENLVTAINDMTMNASFLSTNDPRVHALTTLVVVLGETRKKAMECQEAEWNAAAKPKVA